MSRRASRTPLAWLNLRHDLRRLGISLAGVGFAVVLMFTELGFLVALLDATVAPLELLEARSADLVMISDKRRPWPTCSGSRGDGWSPPRPAEASQRRGRCSSRARGPTGTTRRRAGRSRSASWRATRTPRRSASPAARPSTTSSSGARGPLRREVEALRSTSTSSAAPPRPASRWRSSWRGARSAWSARSRWGPTSSTTATSWSGSAPSMPSSRTVGSATSIPRTSISGCFAWSHTGSRPPSGANWSGLPPRPTASGCSRSPNSRARSTLLAPAHADRLHLPAGGDPRLRGRRGHLLPDPLQRHPRPSRRSTPRSRR